MQRVLRRTRDFLVKHSDGRSSLHTLRFKEDPILSKTCDSVDLQRPDKLKTIDSSLRRIVKENEGVGLAAPQIGELLRMFTMARLAEDLASVECFETIVNPVIVSKSQDDIVYDFEGCLSIPGVAAIVPRFNSISVEYQTLSKDNITSPKIETTLSGFEARIFQHEFDHLNGILYPEHAVPGSFLEEEVYRNLDTETYEAHVKKYTR